MASMALAPSRVSYEYAGRHDFYMVQLSRVFAEQASETNQISSLCRLFLSCWIIIRGGIFS